MVILYQRSETYIYFKLAILCIAYGHSYIRITYGYAYSWFSLLQMNNWQTGHCLHCHSGSRDAPLEAQISTVMAPTVARRFKTALDQVENCASFV